MKSLKLWFGITLVGIGAGLCYPGYRIARWGVALVRRQRERLDPEARESLDGMVRKVRTMAHGAQEG
ncbi:MAG: hypothetical protein OXK77_08640 [Gemmatimonadota bacterium]|nr:hypothetical protein [Gemmatimonadota bacterium]MDE2783010.1 hypothetical protein [Gemmatimonadota bacterium]MDE2865109.1 hypothetical protein [Gemmatimonadota bacterium]MXV96694.1 hypothetical protein [Gemmatimonadota bacterium]MYB05168.1 hypothetical protein [Gemmatimonadota bacterium]